MFKLSLSAWSHPARAMVRRVIALGMALSFLFPVMSWAFQVQAYDTDPGTAAAPEITPDLGKVISASRGTLGTTLYLIQDLHCNVEVQTNIRRILDQLKKKNPDLKLVAVEGATGIIPTSSLASLPNTPSKRAVAAYFMREGKLSGADVAAICDQPQVELFGAENRALYAQSLALIQDFVTESNRGLVFELMDRIKFLQARQYNAQLLAFEKRREAMLAGRLDVRDYHATLVRQALQMNVPLGMEKFNGSGGGWDLYERTLLDRVLEAKIRARLLKTVEEKQLSAYYLYVEAAEHILSISASQAEVDAFKAASQTLSLTAIQKSLQAEFRKMDYYAGVDPAFADEVAALEKNMQKGLQFYQLAQQRNNALFEKATARLRARGERKAALVAGGFHTEGIAQLARAQGYSVVVVRPRQVNPDATNNYFLRLRYPDQPTELERLLTSLRIPAGAAIAVPDPLRDPAFQQVIQDSVAESDQALAALKAGRVTTAGQETLESRPDGVIKLRLPRGAVFYLTYVKGELFVDRSLDKVLQFRQAAGLNSLPADNTVRGALRLPVVRIAGLLVLGLGASVLVAQLIAGAALLPVFVTLGLLGLVMLGLWSLASMRSLTIANLVTRRNVLLGSVLLGASVFTIGLGTVLSNAFTNLSSKTADPSRVAAWVLGMGLKFTAVLGMTPHHHDPIVAGQTVLNIASAASNLLVGPLFSTPYRLMIGLTNALFFKNSKTVLGQSYTDAATKAVAKLFAEQEREQKGIQILPDDRRPVKGTFALLRDEDTEEMFSLLNRFFPNFENVTPIDFFITPLTVVNQDHIAATPIESEIVFQPSNITGRTELLYRVIAKDYKPFNEKGEPLDLTEFPVKSREAILNTLDPSAFHKALGGELHAIFARGGKYETLFKVAFSIAAKKWTGHPGPKDMKTLQFYLKLALLHEFVHALALHLPDNIPENVDQAERARLMTFSVSRYLTLLLGVASDGKPNELQTSVAFVKNLMKAGQTVAAQSPSEATQNQMVRILALEMFCDRFSMFLFETYRKLQIYQEYIPDLGEITVDVMRKIEKQRLTTPEPFRTMNGLSLEAMRELSGKLKAAESEHVYISAYGDPAITDAEKLIFEPFLDLLRHFDKEKALNSITDDHSKGEFVKASITEVKPQINQLRVGIETAIGLTEAGIDGPVGIAVAAAGAVQKALNPSYSAPLIAALDEENAPQLEAPAKPGAGEFNLDEEIGTVVVSEPSQVIKPEVGQPASLFNVAPFPGASQNIGTPGVIIEKPSQDTFDLDDVLAGESSLLPTEGIIETPQVGTAGKVQPQANLAAKLDLIEKQKQEQGQSNRYEIGSANVVAAERPQTEGVAAGLNAVGFNAERVGIAGGVLLMAQPQTAPVTQPTTSPQINTANQGLAAGRAAQLLPGLFDLWNTQPGPPPHTPGLPFWVVSNDPALVSALVGILQGPPIPGISAPDWAGFGQSIQVQIIDPALGERGGGTGVPGSSFAASDLGKMSPKDAYQKLLNATPAGIPRAGSVNGLVVVTPSTANAAVGNAAVNAAIKGAINPATGLPFNAVQPAGVQNLALGETPGERTAGQNAGILTGGENVAATHARLSGAPGTTGLVYPNGTLGIPLQVVGVPLNQMLPGSVPAEILSRSNALKSAALNGAEYGDMLLLTRDQFNAAEVQGLLENFDRGNNLVQVVVNANAIGLLETQLGTQGYQQVLTLRKLVDAQAAQLKAAFAAGAKSVPVALDTVSADTMKKLAASLSAGNLAVFGSSASSLLSKMAAFPGLSEIAKNAGLATIHAGDTGLLAETAAPDSFLTEDLDLLEEAGAGRLNEASSDVAALSALAGHPMTQAQATEFMDLLKAQDQVLYLSTNRSHGTALEERSRLTGRPVIMDIVNNARGTRESGRLFSGAKAIPELAETPYRGAKGWLRTFSMVALGVAALTLATRSVRNLNTPWDGKGFKAQRLPLIPMLTHPAFIRALRLMARIVVGNYGDRDIQDPLVRQQLADLRQLEATGVRVADLKVGSADIPVSLRYSLTHLLWLKGFLGKIPFFNAFLKFRGVQLDTLNPELLMLVNEFLSMEGVSWYFAKQTYLLKQIEAHRAVLDPVLYNFLMLSPADLPVARAERVRELQSLGKLTNPSAEQALRADQLRLEIRHLAFVRHLQKVVAQMDKDNSPRLVKSLLWLLIGQLSRRDISDPYADSILTLISLIDPDNRMAVQMTAVRDGQVKTLYLNMPLVLKNSAVHLEMFMRNFPLLYDQKGRPIVAPERNHIVSALQAA